MPAQRFLFKSNTVRLCFRALHWEGVPWQLHAWSCIGNFCSPWLWWCCSGPFTHGFTSKSFSDGDLIPMTTVPTPRLLLVEDHPDLGDATAEFLRCAGLEVRVALTGAEALTSAVAFCPHIVLCDLNLVDMTGLEIARVLRENPVTRDSLFAIHTALSGVDICTFERAVPKGDVNLYLSKPMTMEKLDRLLAAFEFLRQSRIKGSTD
jgi:CheY-like chemotaxis protein